VRNLIIAVAVTATVALGGALAWQAKAAAPASPVPLAGPYTPIHPAACAGPNVDCAPGRHRVCGPYGQHCWCAPC
jgi:hypothetical protein